MNYFSELKRRNIFKVAIAYLALAWVMFQIADVVVPALSLPDIIMTTMVMIGMIGFPFALFFAWAYELTADGVKRTEDVEVEESIRATTGQKINYIIIGLMAIAITFLLYDRSSESNEENVVAEVVTELENTIAVMPFADMSADGSQEYFGDGMAEEILNVLVSVDELDVTSRTTAFSLKKEDLSIPEIAERLNVNYILEGSIRSDGNMVRVTAQLIDVANDTHLWSETFDRELTSIFAIQDEISLAISDALQVELLDDVLGDVPTQNTDAYALYLQGKLFFNNPTFQAALNATELANRAIELDPDYADAWALLAMSHRVSIFLGMGEYADEEIRELMELARQAIDKAISLDPSMGYVWAIKSALHLQNHEWAEAKISAERATELSPNNNNVWAQMGTYYLTVGIYEKATDAFNRTIKLNPTDFLSFAYLGLVYGELGEVERGVEQLDKAIANGFSPAEMMKANVLLSKGITEGYAEAANTGNAFVGLPKNDDLQDFVDAYLDPSLRDDLRDQLKILPTFPFAQPEHLLLMDGDFLVKDARAKIAKSASWFQFPMNTSFRAVMSQPVMKEYLNEIGLVDHWLETEWPSFCRPVGDDDFECNDGKGNWPQ